MVDLKAFRKVNSLTQIELAEFFGVGQGFISQMEKGDRPIPREYISKILANTYGWDVSMLTESQPENPVVEKPEDAGTIERLFALIDDQRAEIKMLLNMLKEKDEKIEELRKELDARKGKTASDADGSSAAIAV